jgi:hypothetical protein
VIAGEVRQLPDRRGTFGTGREMVASTDGVATKPQRRDGGRHMVHRHEVDAQIAGEGERHQTIEHTRARVVRTDQKPHRTVHGLVGRGPARRLVSHDDRRPMNDDRDLVSCASAKHLGFELRLLVGVAERLADEQLVLTDDSSAATRDEGRAHVI